jgi:hypothetical protein
MALYFDHLMEKMEAGFPMYFTRFEELISHPKPELIGVFQFLMSCTDTEGTVLEQRIDDALALGKEKTQTYRMKTGKRHYKCDEDMYSEA